MPDQLPKIPLKRHKKTRPEYKKISRWFHFVLSTKSEKAYFIDNLRMLLSSGTDILSSLKIIEKEIKTGVMLRLVKQLQNDIDNGMPVTQALEKANLLSAREIALLKIGEETGRIPESLDVIARQEEKQSQLSSKIRSAMLYPTLIFSVTIILATGIAWFILPKLATVFDQLHMELPWITKVTIGIGKFLNAHGYVAIPMAFILLSFFLYFIFVYRHTKHIGQKIFLATPGVKRLIQEAEIARFGFLLGTLLNAGVPIINALDSLQDATTIAPYQRLYRHLSQTTRDGHSIHEGLMKFRKSHKLIPLPVQYMVASAEQSGRLSETLVKIGERFEIKTEYTTKNLGTLIEPVLIIFVWMGVVFVALSIILPIYSLIGGLTQ